MRPRPKKTVTSPHSLGRAIKQARKELGWSQDELSKKSGVSRPQISNIESAKCNPRTTTLFELLRALDCKLKIHPLDETPSKLGNLLRGTTSNATP